jgi:hypothetical protein
MEPPVRDLGAHRAGALGLRPVKVAAFVTWGRWMSSGQPWSLD